ncbi:hypothetical protein NEUTE1DRAFT_117663 [Neurospora tetrasperma FGSC 2508]|uniref:Uncharacterized protein n=1 Tax=Neurospora tetrasperma (strain FGSC 2508 / ATCC MYA-4615 / P0657) TaxID=510951 RepID=F8MSL7_NEUT8|nr:uncharacterized protein NEUTE1DRAFT_117663 [Neurospora tetrasperma FGSC 2508]EGO55104.1 hypothetical protein NEUTE1DRAFT_117663 [Neurospora tetrasperma FGSC 2508]EGZ69687.1 hypothetical protein NEUTE2DRAFT_145628 [Neurospora tetrasperma FGSC 2509]
MRMRRPQGAWMDGWMDGWMDWNAVGVLLGFGTYNHIHVFKAQLFPSLSNNISTGARRMGRYTRDISIATLIISYT